ncbi:MAG: zinc-ribbon domain-containing protein [Myxococcaceae bacterium]|nr:zinc-ribbon domain-containing protein [Myxococcaceae bacterium]
MGKFCNQCGKPLMTSGVKCACGAELPPGAKFCAGCGKPVG